ncbi:MAG: binding-protein-dependent transport system inner rane component [Anaerocolumna sp.]|jgi:ABC-type glycerol-3-phosphate transport system permease component|nr:binding-protein-dependent transport system inner rane component [Anaerocolumna sp.]
MIESKSIHLKLIRFLIYTLLIILVLSCFLPLLYTLAVSLSAKSAVAAGKVAFWPVDFTTYSYHEIMKDVRFFGAFWTSIKRVVVAMVLSLMTMISAAYPLSKTKHEFAARNYILWLLVFCMIFSGGLIPWYIVMKTYKFTNNVFGLALGGGIPVFNLILVVNFFQTVPAELEEAAKVDGAGPWYVLFRVFVPLSKPVLATVTLFTIVGHWNEFFQGLVLSSNAEHYPLQTYIKQLIVVIDTSKMTEDQYKTMELLSNTSLNAAKIFISMIPILCIYPLLQRYFVTGIMLGGVKE